MRRIKTRDEENRKLKRNQIIIGVVLIGLMGISVFGYSFMDNSNPDENSGSIDYNGITFFQSLSGYWTFNLDNSEYFTLYNPNEVENFSVQVSLSLINYIDKPLYFAGYSGEAYTEIAQNLYQFMPRNPQTDVCIAGYDINCSSESPTKNCTMDNIIYIGENLLNKTSVYQEENCIFINADVDNQTKYADALIYRILRIR